MPVVRLNSIPAVKKPWQTGRDGEGYVKRVEKRDILEVSCYN